MATLSRNWQSTRMTVHLFGATSSASCASYALKRTAEDNCKQYRVSPRKCVSQGGAGCWLRLLTGGVLVAIVDSDSLPQCGRELVDPLIN